MDKGYEFIGGVVLGALAVVTYLVRRYPGKLLEHRVNRLKKIRNIPASTDPLTIEQTIAAESEIRGGFVQTFTTITAFSAAALAIVQLVHSDETTRDQINLSRVGQTSDEFSRAVGQLGNGDEATRLGGVYSLEQVVDQDPSLYKVPTIAVLSALVRTYISKTSEQPLTPPPLQEALSALSKYGETNGGGIPDSFARNLI